MKELKARLVRNLNATGMILILTFHALPLLAGIPEVPARLEYCGMDLFISPGAREKMKAVIARLHQSPEQYELLADRVMLYMPFVEDAFGLVDVPSDLKYICILESGMISDAISPSNAIGFWQFKDFTGKSMGLIIDDKVDERKHIWRSSFAAAKYFHQLNGIFDNWIYAIIGYNEGATGAMPYTNKDDFGRKKMIISENIHPYAMKAIAFCLAFKPEIATRARPAIRLRPLSNRGEISALTLAEKHNMDLRSFKSYNLWIRNISIPEYPPFTYYIPVPNEPKDASPDPHRDFYLENKLATVNSPIQPIQPEEFSNENPSGNLQKPANLQTIAGRPEPDPDVYEIREIESDHGFGHTFTLAGKGESWKDIAFRTVTKSGKLMKWNWPTEPELLQIIYLKPPRHRYYHIAQKGESPWTISRLHKTGASDIALYNDLPSVNSVIETGRKIYLRYQKPDEEKIVVLMPSDSMHIPVKRVKPVIAAPAGPGDEEIAEPAIAAPEIPENYFSVPPRQSGKTSWTWHTVSQGETLWAIYKKYGMRVEMIRKVNELISDSLKPGQKLKIMVR